MNGRFKFEYYFSVLFISSTAGTFPANTIFPSIITAGVIITPSFANSLGSYMWLISTSKRSSSLQACFTLFSVVIYLGQPDPAIIILFS